MFDNEVFCDSIFVRSDLRFLKIYEFIPGSGKISQEIFFRKG